MNLPAGRQVDSRRSIVVNPVLHSDLTSHALVRTYKYHSFNLCKFKMHGILSTLVIGAKNKSVYPITVNERIIDIGRKIMSGITELHSAVS